MFGIGLSKAYGNYTFDWLGGMNAAFLVAIATRMIVGVAWYRMFDRAGKKPHYAFIPLLGPYTAFRMVWDDFSMSFLFASTTIIAFIDAIMVGEGNAIISAFSVVNFILWWFMALLTSVCFQCNMIVGFVYGGIPWFGSLLMAFWPSARYKGPWSSDPEADQNLSSQERKTRRKKAAKAAKAKKEQERRDRKGAQSQSGTKS